MTYHLGDRYYVVRQSGVIEARRVDSLPFFPQPNDISDLEEALALAIPRLETHMNASDSLSYRYKCQELLDIYQIGAKLLEPRFAGALPDFPEELSKLMHVDRMPQYPETVPNPESYLKPGSIVFVVVTPHTHYSSMPGWRPALYFVFRVRLKSVSWVKFGSGVMYHLDSRYSTRTNADVCASLKGARDRLTELILEQVPTAMVDRKRIPVFGHQLEKKFWKDWFDRQRGLRFGLLSDGAD